MGDSANGAALLQHPDHFATGAIDIDKAFECAFIAEIGRLAEA
jgi:hypothetical protein